MILSGIALVSVWGGPLSTSNIAHYNQNARLINLLDEYGMLTDNGEVHPMITLTDEQKEMIHPYLRYFVYEQ